jgi:hypothetical protein
MTTRLLLAILVALSLCVSGCSSNRRVCRRSMSHPPGCYCCSPSTCGCGCNSCGMNNCSMGGCSSCSGGMCSECGGGSCPMCSGGSGGTYSGYSGGEMMEGAAFMPSDGGYMGPDGMQNCNCGSP